MDDILKAVRHLGVATNIILIFLGIIMLAYLYKSVLETQKLRLEIRKLNGDLTPQSA